MTLAEFRREMERFLIDAQAEATYLKDPSIVGDQLKRLYVRFDDDEKELANEVFREWLMGGDSERRVYAMWLARHFKTKSLLPDLRHLACRLEGLNDMDSLSGRLYAQDAIETLESE